jgi:hypothetical protein
MKDNSEEHQYRTRKGKYIQHNQEVQNDRVNIKDSKENLHYQFAEMHLKQCFQKELNLIAEVNQDSVHSVIMKLILVRLK